MAAGGPGDYPVTDTVLWEKHPFTPELEAVVKELYAMNPGVFNRLEGEPFHWANGKRTKRAIELLTQLIESHGQPHLYAGLIKAYLEDVDSR